MGSDDTLDGMSKIKRFKKEPFPKILVSVNMLDTGFDCPPVVNLVFTRFTRSSILYQQMRGRGTRKIPGKPCFTMFDFVGVCDYHGDQDEMAEGGLVVETPKKKKHESRRLLALDIDDHIDPTTREWITLDENGNMVFPEVSEQKAVELDVRFEAWLLTRNDLTPIEESWLRVIGNPSEVTSWKRKLSASDIRNPVTASKPIKVLYISGRRESAGASFSAWSISAWISSSLNK
jgi:type I restriction enzyme R subunit